MRPAILPAILLSSCFLILTGCGMQNGTPEANVAGTAFKGHVIGGQNPVTGSSVQIWEVGNTGYGNSATNLATATTDATGAFSFAAGAYTCDYSNSELYITATAGNSGSGNNPNLQLMATLGPCGSAASQVVNINEVTTVASVFALAQFMNPQLGPSASPYIGGTVAGYTGTNSAGLVAAFTNTIPALVNEASGTVQPSTSSKTIESAKLYTLANVLASCVNSTGESDQNEAVTPCGILFADTNATQANPRPYTTLQAALMIALHPYYNVTPIYNRAGTSAPFTGGLTTPPNDWTVAVAYNTASMGTVIDNTSLYQRYTNIDIDIYGDVWFASNIPGANGVGYFNPAAQTFNGPYGGMYVTKPQYLAIDQSSNVWVTDTASSVVLPVLVTDPTNNRGDYSLGGSLSGGPVSVNDSNTVFFTYTNASGAYRLGKFTNSGGVVDDQVGFTYPATSIKSNVQGASDIYGAYSGASSTCDLGLANGTTAALQTSTGSAGCIPGGIANVGTPAYTDPPTAIMTVPSLNELCVAGANDTPRCLSSAVEVNAPEGIATDGSGNLWIANSGEGSISTESGAKNTVNGTEFTMTSPVAYFHGSSNGNTMTNPYSLAIDGSGNVWTMSPACVVTATNPTCTPSPMIVTEVVGVASPTIAPLSEQTNHLTGTRPVR